jgi:hypothetical protein
MKSKRKFDKKVIQQFFIDHTEKIVIGAVGLMFLYFAYSAVMLEVNENYKKEPKNLTDAITAAQNTIHAGPRGKTPAAETPIPPYAERIETFKLALDPNRYPFDKDLIIAPIGQPHLRGTPEIVAIKDLRAAPGRGALVSNDGNNGTVGQRWVVVTGLVPYERELAEYKSKFQDAGTQTNHDAPEYAGFLVQRGEVVPGAAAGPSWEASMTFCTPATFGPQFQKWSGVGPEVVDHAHTLPELTSPLPRLATAEWGDEVAFPPEIKVLPPEERSLAQGQQQPGQDSMQGGNFPAGQRPDRFVGQPGPSRGQPGPGRTGQRGPSPAPGGQPAADIGPDELIGGTPPGPKPDVAVTKPVDVPKYYLLRYFDFDVEPGKQYVYRVFLILKNPNLGVAGSDLMEEKESTQRFLGLKTENAKRDPSGKLVGLRIEKDNYWSAACQAAKVPGDLRLLAGATEPPKVPSPTETTGDVRILHWDKESGESTNGVFPEQFRGTVLDGDVPMKVPGVQGRKSTHISSGCLLADLAGGDVLSARDKDKLHSPGMMLVLDENGNLVILDEVGETKEWTAETKEPDRAPQDRGTAPGQRRGFEGGPGRRPPGSRGPRGRDSGPSPPDSALPDMK